MLENTPKIRNLYISAFRAIPREERTFSKENYVRHHTSFPIFCRGSQPYRLLRCSQGVCQPPCKRHLKGVTGEKQPLQITSKIADPAGSFAIPAAFASADELQLRVPGPDGRSRLTSVPTSKVTFVTEEGAPASLFPFMAKVST